MGAKKASDSLPEEEVEVIIDEATTLVVSDVEYSGTVPVTQEVANELLKSGRASIVTLTEEK